MSYINTTKQKQLKNLKLEQIKISDLIKSLQKICFVDKKISVQTYRNKSQRYEERLLEIKRTIPVLENIVKGNKENNGKDNNGKDNNRKDNNGKSDQKEIKRKVKGVIEVKR